MAQTSEQRSFIVSFVKVPEVNKQGKMRQGLKILTNQGEKWLNITQEPWLSPQTKNQSVNFEVWMYNDRMYGKLAGAAPTVGLPAQQGLPQAAQAPKSSQIGQSDQEKTTRLSIERQTAIKAACEFYANWKLGTGDISKDDEVVIRFAQKVAYFISTGFNLADKEKIDREEKLAAAELAGEQIVYESSESQEQPPPF